MIYSIEKIVLLSGTVVMLSSAAFGDIDRGTGESLGASHFSLEAFPRIEKIRNSVRRVEELSVDIGHLKVDLEQMSEHCMTNKHDSVRQMDREYKLLKAKLYNVWKGLAEVETRMENYDNMLMEELLEQKMENGELANGQEYLGWTALDFVESTNKTSGIQQRVAYPLGSGCRGVVVELLQGCYCFSWHHESEKSILYRADINQNMAVMIKLFFEKGKPSGFMTKPFEKWCWKQFKKSDLKEGECYVILDRGKVFVSRSQESDGQNEPLMPR